MKWTTWSHPRLSKSKKIYVSWWLVHIYLNLLKDLNLSDFFGVSHVSYRSSIPTSLAPRSSILRWWQSGSAIHGYWRLCAPVSRHSGWILVGFAPWNSMVKIAGKSSIRSPPLKIHLGWKWCTSDHETCPTFPTHGKGLNSNSMCHWHTQLKVALEIVPWIHGTCLYASKSSNKKMASQSVGWYPVLSYSTVTW